jgi:hypothetical protein
VTSVTTSVDDVDVSVSIEGEISVDVSVDQPVIGVTAISPDLTVETTEAPVVQVNVQGKSGPPGPQGIPGPTGPQGPAGPAGVGASYRHVQDVPSATWIITHNLPYRPNVEVVVNSGNGLTWAVTEVFWPDDVTVRVETTSPATGEAYLT